VYYFHSDKQNENLLHGDGYFYPNLYSVVEGANAQSSDNLTKTAKKNGEQTQLNAAFQSKQPISISQFNQAYLRAHRLTHACSALVCSMASAPDITL
jgi:hypothetical protein